MLLLKEDEDFCMNCGGIASKEELETYDGICQDCYNEINGTHNDEYL